MSLLKFNNIPPAVYWWPQSLDVLRHRFSRSKLGPLWVILNTVIYVSTLSFIFSNVFGNDFNKTISYIGIGIIFWNYMSLSLTDCCNSFIENASSVQNSMTPILSYPMRSLSVNFLYFSLNLTFLALLIIMFVEVKPFMIVCAVIGLILFSLNVFFFGIFLSVLSVRFRDVPFLVSNFLQVMFFVTPIIWSLENMEKRFQFLELNPFYLLIELVRAPLLRNEINNTAIFFAISFSLFSIVVLRIFVVKNLKKIPLWT